MVLGALELPSHEFSCVSSNFDSCEFQKDIYWSPGLDKGTSVITFTAATTAAMFPNADDHLGNWVENPSQYN